MKVTLLDSTVDPLYVISACARTSHATPDKPEERERLVKDMIRLEHSPVEFGWTVWDISGISRACADQLRTYRIASHCMQSQRYVDISDNEFIYPVKAVAADESCIDFVSYAKAFYKKLLKAGVSREDARYFMPIGMSCSMKVGMNMRNLRHFFKQRLAKGAQWEIKQVAISMLEICQDKWPWLVEDIEVE